MAGKLIHETREIDALRRILAMVDGRSPDRKTAELLCYEIAEICRAALLTKGAE